MASMNLISTQKLTKQYGGILANSNVDFELATGQITALIGPNGAGKSTFVGMLCGRIDATSGEVFFKGENISHLPAYKRIRLGMAYTFQITSIFSGLSLFENVALAARPNLSQPNNEKQLNDKVYTVLKRVGLDDRAMQIASDLSYGHQRLLEIAMGLAQDPELFILDEPTQGLAESEVTSFIELV
jgi:branched-chain amino acid transport system ATP-binding protein